MNLVRQCECIVSRYIGINSPLCILSVWAIHLIQKVYDQMKHSIKAHGPDPVCQPCAACQYGANVKQQEEKRPKEEEGDKIFHRSCLAHKAESLLSKHHRCIAHPFKATDRLF